MDPNELTEKLIKMLGVTCDGLAHPEGISYFLNGYHKICLLPILLLSYC